MMQNAKILWSGFILLCVLSLFSCKKDKGNNKQPTEGEGVTDISTTTIGAYAILNNDNANDIAYGKLYNWHAVNIGKLAPAG